MARNAETGPTRRPRRATSSRSYCSSRAAARRVGHPGQRRGHRDVGFLQHGQVLDPLEGGGHLVADGVADPGDGGHERHLDRQLAVVGRLAGRDRHPAVVEPLGREGHEVRARAVVLVEPHGRRAARGHVEEAGPAHVEPAGLAGQAVVVERPAQHLVADRRGRPHLAGVADHHRPPAPQQGAGHGHLVEVVGVVDHHQVEQPRHDRQHVVDLVGRAQPQRHHRQQGGGVDASQQGPAPVAGRGQQRLDLGGRAPAPPVAHLAVGPHGGERPGGPADLVVGRGQVGPHAAQHGAARQAQVGGHLAVLGRLHGERHLGQRGLGRRPHDRAQPGLGHPRAEAAPGAGVVGALGPAQQRRPGAPGRRRAAPAGRRRRAGRRAGPTWRPTGPSPPGAAGRRSCARAWPGGSGRRPGGAPPPGPRRWVPRRRSPGPRPSSGPPARSAAAAGAGWAASVAPSRSAAAVEPVTSSTDCPRLTASAATAAGGRGLAGAGRAGGDRDRVVPRAGHHGLLGRRQREGGLDRLVAGGDADRLAEAVGGGEGRVGRAPRPAHRRSASDRGTGGRCSAR